jgi:hypothetical protein
VISGHPLIQVDPLQKAIAFLKEFLPLHRPPNFQLVADELETRFGFKRNRESVAALGVTHLVAPSPQAKGKIKRRFGTLQKRLVAILAYEKVSHYAAAQIVLDREVQRQNTTVCRTTSLSPNVAREKALAEKRALTRPCPLTTLLDLHLALHLK